MIAESQSPRNGNDNYFLFLLSIATILIIILCFKLYFTQHEVDRDKQLLSSYETDIIELNNNIQYNKVRVDTIYSQKINIKREYINKIKTIFVLDVIQHDSLFGLIYPSKDSANRTYYHYLHASEQLFLSDSIIVFKDTIISDLNEVINKKDTLLSLKDKELKTQKKLTTRAYFKGGIIGLLIGLLIP